MSLRGRKYGDEWSPVWKFLADKHGVPGPLGLDEAVEEVASKLEANQSLVPGRVEPTVFELVGDAHLIGLRQDHVARLAGIVSGDDQQRVQLLEHAASHLNWDTADFHDWADVIGSDPKARTESVPFPEVERAPGVAPFPEEDTAPGVAPFPEAERTPGVAPFPEVERPPGVAPFPEVKRAPGVAPVSLHNWTTQLAADGLTSMPPLPDTPACSSTEVGGSANDGHATTVFGRFDMAARIEDLIYATDPRNWPDCSWFFISMTEQTSPVLLPPPDDVGSSAYSCDLEELVGLEELLTVRTGLSTRYFVGADSVGMEFDLTPGTHGDGKVDVDHGFLLAEKHPSQQGKVVVTSQKTFSFVGLDDLPFSFLCEFGWIDMMRAMAQCRRPGG
ncbi:MAG TPA: hypothetical protein VFP42_09675 [Acidimicrobiia bacterium]|nr:hypothetical protein [Acidimicrobiia bacterium]